MVAALVSTSGDQLVAESEAANVDTAWTAQVSSQAKTARWRLVLLAPPDVADAGKTFANASEVLGKAIAEAGGWQGPDRGSLRRLEARLDAARTYLDPL